MADGKARLPPRWFVVTFWHVHRWFVRATGGRKGLWRPRPGKWGAMRLTATGRAKPKLIVMDWRDELLRRLAAATPGGYSAKGEAASEPTAYSAS